MRIAIISTVLILSIFLNGCCTIFGMAGDVPMKINSTPAGASVRVDGKYEGVTPITVRLARRQTHKVSVEYAGKTYDKELGPGVNPMLFGNIIFGGIIGILVDAIDGAGTTLYPFSVDADFGEKNSVASKSSVAKASEVPNTTPGVPVPGSKEDIEHKRRWKEMEDKLYAPR